MKKAKIVFWVTAIIIFVFEGVMSALTSNSEMARQGITSLGYPVYFGTMLMVFKVLGSLALVLPQVPARIKEWAFVGFGFDFICAFLSLVIVNGFTSLALGPLVFMVVLYFSYTSYHKIKNA